MNDADTNIGTVVGSGAIVAVTVRKAIVAWLIRLRLRERCRSLQGELATTAPQLQFMLDMETRLWESKGISNEQFGERLDVVTDELRGFLVGVSKHVVARGEEAAIQAALEA